MKIIYPDGSIGEKIFQLGALRAMKKDSNVFVEMHRIINQYHKKNRKNGGDKNGLHSRTKL